VLCRQSPFDPGMELKLAARGVAYPRLMSEDELRVELEPAAELSEAIRSGLIRANKTRVTLEPIKHVVVHARDGSGRLLGGVIAGLGFSWAYVDVLWVDEAERRRGLGTKLLARLEEVARQQGIFKARLNTASFQGQVAFYERRGYQVFAQLPFATPDGQRHVDYFMKKDLTAP